jgi:anti-sigma regulatory factor (Ser/Thr protein kinase)
MTGAAVRESVKVAGLVERARVVRAFVGAVLGPGHPCGDDAVLLASELFANSLQHGGSGIPGETVTVTVTARAGAVRVEVADRGGPGVPEVRPASADAEDGRGLGLVAGLAVRWGWRRRGARMVTWFELCDLLQLMQHSALSGMSANSPDVQLPGS